MNLSIITSCSTLYCSGITSMGTCWLDAAASAAFRSPGGRVAVPDQQHPVHANSLPIDARPSWMRPGGIGARAAVADRPGLQRQARAGNRVDIRMFVEADFADPVARRVARGCCPCPSRPADNRRSRTLQKLPGEIADQFGRSADVAHDHQLDIRVLAHQLDVARGSGSPAAAPPAARRSRPISAPAPNRPSSESQGRTDDSAQAREQPQRDQAARTDPAAR